MDGWMEKPLKGLLKAIKKCQKSEFWMFQFSDIYCTAIAFQTIRRTLLHVIYFKWNLHFLQERQDANPP